MMLKKAFGHLLANRLLVVVIFIGALTWSLTMVKSGLVYSYGMGFWGANAHDGLWHVALIRSLSKGSLQMPIFAGENLKNYHIGFDLLLAVIYKVTKIPAINLYFQIVPPIVSVLIGILTYRFVFTWKKSKTQALWSTFFVYFSGSFGWVVTYLKNKTINGESIFWAQQSISTLINPPFALSLVVMIFALSLLFKEEKSGLNIKKLLIIVLLFGVLVQIKIYAGVLILIALFISGIWEYLRSKKTLYLKVFILSFFISILILIPTYNLRSGGLIFQPFWFLDSMVSTVDRFYWPKMASALYNYRLLKNILKGSLAYSLVFLLFLFGNLGIRLVSLSYIEKKILKFKKMDKHEILFFTIIFCGIIIPMLFIQNGNSWNSIQFFYYSLFFLSILTGIVLGEFFEKLKTKNRGGILKAGTAYVLIFLLTLFTLISSLRHYLPQRPPAKISKEELSAIKFLEMQPKGIVLTIPYNREYAQSLNLNPPIPVYLYESTAYVSALSGKSMYLEDEVNLEITGYSWEKRAREIIDNFANIDYFKGLGIEYIYIPDVEHFVYKDEMEGYSIYNKGGVAVYKI